MPTAFEMIMLVAVIIAMSWVTSRSRRRLPEGKKRPSLLKFLLALFVFVLVSAPAMDIYLPMPANLRGRGEFVSLLIVVTVAAFLLLAYMYLLFVAPLMDRMWLAAENSARRMMKKRADGGGKHD